MSPSSKDAGLRPVADPLIGRTIAGRYRLISRLGRGGMSSVYLARHVLIDRLIAIKTLRRDLARQPVQRDRFLREARAVNRINHKNIVEITDFGESDDELVYLVMEYVPGESLHKVLGEGPMNATRALAIGRQIGSALGRAHQMGVIHRDLKPENVLLVRRRGKPDFVKILDFGIAKILDAPSLTGSQQIFGTPGYIAPEYIQSTEIDGRADLYSLGVILYELITGALPFDYEYPGDLLVKHVTEQPIPPRQRLPSIARSVEELLLQCLRKDPAKRFRDAYHFLQEVDRVAELLGSDESWGAMSQPSGTFPRVDPGLPPGAVLDGDPFAETVRTPGAETADEIDAAPARDTIVDLSPFRPPQATTAEEIAVDDVIPPAPPSMPDPEMHGIGGLFGWRRRYEALARRLGERDADGARAALDHASTLLAELTERVADIPRREALLEELRAQARDFRATLGKAVDAVAGNLSTHRGELEELVARRDRLRQRREGVRHKVRKGEADEGEADALLWELAAVEERLRRAGARCDELEYQLAELRNQLEAENERVEAEGAVVADQLAEILRRVDDLGQHLGDPLDRVEAALASLASRERETHPTPETPAS